MIESEPSPPTIVSAEAVPVIVSLPAPPSKTTEASVTVIFEASITSAFAVPTTVNNWEATIEEPFKVNVCAFKSALSILIVFPVVNAEISNISNPVNVKFVFPEKSLPLVCAKINWSEPAPPTKIESESILLAIVTLSSPSPAEITNEAALFTAILSLPKPVTNAEAAATVAPIVNLSSPAPVSTV